MSMKHYEFVLPTLIIAGITFALWFLDIIILIMSKMHYKY